MTVFYPIINELHLIIIMAKYKENTKVKSGKIWKTDMFDKSNVCFITCNAVYIVPIKPIKTFFFKNAKL